MSQASAPVLPPAREGVGPSRVALPAGPWPTMLDFLVQRFPAVSANTWRERMADGLVLGDSGECVTAQSAYASGGHLFYYRSVPDEPRIPFDEVVLYQDEHLVVVDKPHFLPVMPSGDYLQETVLVRLKRKLGLDDLAPIHRIDRDTAGLVMFSAQKSSRGAYTALFRQRQVHKVYEAIAPWRAGLALPLTRHSRIVPADHFMLQREVAGPANAVTHIDLLEVAGALARYRLRPVTGQRHQLRVHLAALGVPILGDGLYPALTPKGQIDHDNPLQLLAQSIEFTDPFSGKPQCFRSALKLIALPGKSGS